MELANESQLGEVQMKRPIDARFSAEDKPKKEESCEKKMQKVVFFPKEVQKVFPSVTPP